MKIKLLHTILLLFLFANAAKAQITLTVAVRPATCNTSHDAAAEVIVTAGTPPYIYHWNFGATTFAVRDIPPGNYTVSVTDSSGYDTIVEVEIRSYGVLCGMAPRVVFTPNDDGFNDTWLIDNIEHYPDNRVLVFNRWGQKVFESEDKYIQWDGKDLLGVPAPDGAYYYYIYGNKNDEGTIVKGSVSIIR